MQILAGLAALAVAKLASAHGGGMHYVIDGQIHTGCVTAYLNDLLPSPAIVL